MDQTLFDGVSVDPIVADIQKQIGPRSEIKMFPPCVECGRDSDQSKRIAGLCNACQTKTVVRVKHGLSVKSKRVFPPCLECKGTGDQTRRCRGLCSVCYLNPSIRAKHPPKFNQTVRKRVLFLNCRHCGAPNPDRPRGLCHPCYYKPEIRSGYDLQHILTDVDDDYGDGREPEPTRALPGTSRKLQVLVERAARGEALFSARDRRRELK